jgi:hypothetical protein
MSARDAVAAELENPHAAHHRSLAELQAGLGHVRAAPRALGRLEMIVRRPAVDAREELEVGELTCEEGLVGDGWRHRSSSRTPDRSAHPDMQLAIMGARAVELVAGDRARWALAGDQLFLDLDLTAENLPPGTRLELGTALLQVTPQPHTGCAKFLTRYGADSLRLLGSPEGRRLRMRGIYARVVRPGVVRRGDAVRRLTAGDDV